MVSSSRLAWFEQRIAHRMAYFEHHRIADSIPDADSLASGFDQSCTAQDCELFGNVGLARFDSSHNLADGELSVFERMKNLEANRVAHRLEAVRDALH